VGKKLSDFSVFEYVHRGILSFFTQLQVVRGPNTSDDTFKKLIEYGQKVGKTTVDCKVFVCVCVCFFPCVCVFCVCVCVCVVGRQYR
jgi:hypothetical protein